MARKKVRDEFEIFPQRLSFMMKERKLKQQDLADVLGVKRQTISLYMTGQSMPDAEQLRKIARFFEVSADWLLGMTDDRDRRVRAVDDLGVSKEAIDNLLEAATIDADILSSFLSSYSFLALMTQIFRMKRTVQTIKTAHKVAHKIGLKEDFDKSNVIKTIESSLEDFLGYPVYFAEPRHTIYREIDDVKMSAEALAKEISGYNELSIAERVDHIYDFEERDIKEFAKYIHDEYGQKNE